ncbi:UbiA family prenyltransferase [Angustibacter sp. McL0619]|uniref:UbiA family prenyltransferase n=1 Tax=Angustibacter sp. McL0619 TaxID=3415676 RepID=UPI003CE8CE1D
MAGPLALLGAAHPAPAFVVTALATVLAVAVGADAATTVGVCLAFAAGQLSIGWSNDWRDAERDAASGRTDKPAANGRISRTTVGRAAAVAAVATVPLSLAMGWRAGIAHLVAVAAAWSYNFWLKSTALSWLPFALAFGLLPAVVTLALDPPLRPPAWLVGASALLGVGAHLVNVLPDLEDDRATGVNGFAHRIGRRATAVLAPAVLVAASVLVVFGPDDAPGPAEWLGLTVAVAAAAVAAIAGASTPPRRLLALLGTAFVAATDVALLVFSGSTLH